ncbi:MAG TPA: RES family NAD+ phosphorylase [Bradyrhizobium sp.]|nr:RES family NAD+ phosphorylase [Bradyrhizobium sp.]
MSAPPPPPDLDSRNPELLQLRAGTIIHRFYTREYEPVFFDPGLSGRLNAPDGSYGVLYCAKEPSGAFAETFLRTPGRRLIDADLLRRKAYARLQVRSKLSLIRLAGPGLAILGATAEVVHGGLPYAVPQAWSKALFNHPIAADGIAYHARHDDEALCYAIFDRAGAAITEVGRETDLDQDWFWQLALKYRVGMAPP